MNLNAARRDKLQLLAKRLALEQYSGERRVRRKLVSV